LTSDDLSFLKHVRIETTTEAGAWRLSLPRAPWRHQQAEHERKLLLERLTDSWPFTALWFSDWNSAGAGWRYFAVGAPLADMGELSEGGWLLLFFERDPQRPLPPVSGIPADAEAAIRLLHEFSAGALVASWVDDNEWLVATTRNVQQQ
jgi:hypothetical protein